MIRLTSCDAEMFVREEGEGEPLLFLHAFPLSGEMWRPQWTGLPAGIRGIAPDLPGFGSTPLLSGTEAPSLEKMAEAVAELLDRLRMDRFTLCGLSMGGYLSFALLRIIEAKRIRGLILADTKADADTEEARAGRLEMARRVETEGADPIAGEMIGRLLGDTTRRDRPDLVERVRAIISSNSGAGIAAAQRAMAARADSTPDLAAMKLPVLVIAGEEDALTPPSAAEKMAAAIPKARCRLIPKAGHLSNMEQPDAFNAALHEFIADTRSAR